MIHHPRQLIVGSAGSANSFATIQSVRNRYGGAVFVIAADTECRELVAASVLADAFIQVPPARAPEFPAALRELAASYPNSSYLPMHDEEIEVAARLASEGSLPAGLDLVAPPYEVVRLCNDKWLMHNWLKANGLPAADTVLATAEAIETVPLPRVLKPRYGAGSQGMRLIRDRTELAGLAPEAWLLQELLQEPRLSVDAFLSRSTGIFHSACRVFLGSPFSDPAAAHGAWRVFRFPEAEAPVERLARCLPIFGSFFVQGMSDTSSRWLITDINLRPAGRISSPAGADFPVANLADFWGDSTDAVLKPIIGEYIVSREYVEFVISSSAR